MSSYGRRLVAQIGTSVRVSADGHPETKIGGVTIDWTTVTPAAAAATLNDGVQIEVGDLYLRYGQVLTEITAPAGATVAISATGGTFTITVTTYSTANDQFGNPVTTANPQTTGALAYNASAATVQSAIQGLSNVGSGNATVTLASTTYTITFAAALGEALVSTNPASLTGGSGTATVVQTAFGGDQEEGFLGSGSGGSNIGKYGPYDPNATDGRQTLTIGSAYILNRTIKFNDLNSDHPEVLYGGMVMLARILQVGGGSASLAGGPTLANLLATFPRLQPVTESPSS